MKAGLAALLVAALLGVHAGSANAAQGPAGRPDPTRQDHIAVVWVTSASAAAGPGDQVGTAGRYVEYTQWIPHPDGRRLAVFPTDYARYDAPATDWPAAWDEVTRLEPDADHEHMRDQFRCHVDFARIAEPDKPSWNLELWRPDTGYLGTVLASCNPSVP